MTTLTEGVHPGEFIIAEDEAFHCRQEVTIQSGEGVIVPGQVLGKCRGVADTVSVAVGTTVGTGNGVMTLASPAYGAGVKRGVYNVQFVEPASNLGTFNVIDPEGLIVGRGDVGTAFTGVIKFTIADGSTDFLAGTYIPVTVSITTDAQEFRSCDNTNTDGSDVAYGVAVYGCDATSAAKKIAAIVRGPAQVLGSKLTFDAALDTAAEQTLAKQQLAARGIIVR